MLPLLPFAAGLLAGVVAIRLLRDERTRDELGKFQEKARLGLGKAQDKLRDATISGLSAVESSSAAMKQRLSTEKTAASQPPATAPGAPRKKAAATGRTARKPAAPRVKP